MESIGADVISDGCASPNAAFGLDGDGETDSEDSYFDLVFESPDPAAVRGGGDAEKNSWFTGSPRDVLLSRNRLSDSKASPPVTILRSKPKTFKVLFAFNFRKTPKIERNLSAGDSSSKSAKIDESNRFPAEGTAAASIIAGDNSLRSQLLRESSDCETSPEKLSSRDAAVPKYLKLIKPLYHKVWKKQSEKAKVADSSTPSSPPATAHVNFSPINRTGSFKVAGKRLLKSRSASGAVGVPPARRRDDSLLQQRDGIQGAVLYCRRSYNSSSKEHSQISARNGECQLDEVFK